jgi:hypothetical protein
MSKNIKNEKRTWVVVCRNDRRNLLSVYDNLTEEEADEKLLHYKGRAGRNFTWIEKIEKKEDATHDLKQR